jgi:hypothetical protein
MAGHLSRKLVIACLLIMNLPACDKLFNQRFAALNEEHLRLRTEQQEAWWAMTGSNLF